MNWLASLSLILLLLAAVSDARRHHSGGPSRSPWATPQKAHAFMTCLMQKIGASKAFPQQEKEDLESIVATMMTAVDGMAKSKGSNTKAKHQAMDTALASSLGEFVVAEDAGDLQKVKVKTEALINVVQQCFIDVVKAVNRQFMVEMKDLIDMFVKEAQKKGENEDEYDYDDEEEDGGAGGLSIDLGGDSSTGIDLDAGAPSSGLDADLSLGGGAAGGGNTKSRLNRALNTSLGRSKVLRLALNSQTKPAVANRLVDNTLRSILPALGLDGRSQAAVRGNVLQGLRQVRPGSDTNAYIRAIVNALTDSLISSGAVTDDNVSDLGSNLVSNYILSTGKLAPSMGINIDTDVNADADGSRNLFSTSSSGGAGGLSIDLGGDSSTGFDLDAGFGAGAPSSGLGADITTGGGRPSGTLSLSSLLNSSTGASSPQGVARVNNLVSVLGSPKGINASSLGQALKAVSSSLKMSGMSQSDASLEALIEVLVSALHVLSNSQVSSSMDALSPASISSLGRVIASVL